MGSFWEQFSEGVKIGVGIAGAMLFQPWVDKVIPNVAVSYLIGIAVSTAFVIVLSSRVFAPPILEVKWSPGAGSGSGLISNPLIFPAGRDEQKFSVAVQLTSASVWGWILTRGDQSLAVRISIGEDDLVPVTYETGQGGTRAGQSKGSKVEFKLGKAGNGDWRTWANLTCAAPAPKPPHAESRRVMMNLMRGEKPVRGVRVKSAITQMDVEGT